MRQCVVPNVITYSALISAWKRVEQPEEALKMREFMRRQ